MIVILPAQHTFFLDILADHRLVQVVDSLTREESVLGLLVVNNLTLFNHVEVIPGISDHDAVFAKNDIIPQTRRQTVNARFPFTEKQTGVKLKIM